MPDTKGSPINTAPRDGYFRAIVRFQGQTYTERAFRAEDGSIMNEWGKMDLTPYAQGWLPEFPKE